MESVGLLDRQKYLGGSDVAGILGISPWRTPLDVYLDKIQPRVEITDPARKKILNRGQRMEPYVIDLLSEESGLIITKRGQHYLDPEFPFIAAEIDAEAESGENIEIKTVSPFKVKEWGEQQTDAIPVHYTAQAMHGLMVTGKQVCVFGVLIGGDDFRIYRVERDEETISAIREREVEFWERVCTLNPPPIINSHDVLRFFEKDDGSSMEANGQIISMVNDLREMTAKYNELETDIEFLTEKLKLVMQQHSMITIEGKPIVTWRTQSSTRLDISALKAKKPKIFEQFKKTKKSRVLRIK